MVKSAANLICRVMIAVTSDPLLIFRYFVGCARNFDLMLGKLFLSGGLSED